MASTSEVGHNKNVANFSTGYQILQEMGTLYDPTNPNILLTALTPKKVAVADTIAVLNTQNPIYKNAVANREVAIATLSKTVTQALNYAKSTTISEADKENIEAKVKKIRGDKKQAKVNPETSNEETISTSQMSYDSRIANLDTLNSQLESFPEYIPNETNIKIVSLQAIHSNLETLSSIVNAAGNTLITGRLNRNSILYFEQNNILELVKDIKSYLKSLGQPGAPYYKAFVKLKFSEIKQ